MEVPLDKGAKEEQHSIALCMVQYVLLAIKTDLVDEERFGHMSSF